MVAITVVVVVEVEIMAVPDAKHRYFFERVSYFVLFCFKLKFKYHIMLISLIFSLFVASF